MLRANFMMMMMIMIIIQVFVYLRADSAAQRSIIKDEQKKETKHTHKTDITRHLVPFRQ